MEWHIVVSLVLAIPAILIPVAFIWYLNVSGLRAVRDKAHEKRGARLLEWVA